MNKDQYLLNIMVKVKHKRYEHFVISRIIHKLCGTDVKIVSQQLVRRPSGRALLDLYFPQINVSLEVDEPQHENEAHKRQDQFRSRDIIAATGLTEKRIKVLGPDGEHRSLAELAALADDFLEFVLSKVDEMRGAGSWRPWDFENELTAQPHLERGYIDATEDVLVRKHTDAIQLFGKTLDAHMTGGWRPGEEFGLAMVWFPRLYKNDKWDNSISDDGMKIVEKNLDDDGAYILDPSNYGDNHRRAVFARKEEPLIGVLYRFVGVFEYSPADSLEENAAIYHKISDRIDLLNGACG